MAGRNPRLIFRSESNMITVKQAIKLSCIVDKLDISVANPEATKEQVGADLIKQVMKNIHKAESEIYEFVASSNKCTVEEAEEVDIIKFIKNLFADPEISGFFKSAAKSKALG